MRKIMDRLPGANWAIAFIIIIHLVGVVGFAFNETRWMFQNMVPFHLLLCVVLLIVYMKSRKGVLLKPLIGIFFLGFIAEMIGVNTGLLFGNYAYGSYLGIKIYNTPLMIGVLWAMLGYLFSGVMRSISHKWYFIPLGALLMTLFDLVMEPGAVSIGLWRWEGDYIPIFNYVTWFLLSIPVFTITRKYAVDMKNPLTVSLLLSQMGFFLALTVISYLK
ncbi:MAG: carotenoid biosynthesis protein [Sphingobacteriia bacterium]|nr:carotenoid biosynthesis protein [Sphingobacteriia bacterium]